MTGVTVFRYVDRCAHPRHHLLWSGTTGTGYRNYPRGHRAAAPTAAEIALSADPHFHGDAKYTNPEQLLVMAASSCQLLSFLALAARRGVDVIDYDDRARGEMPDSARPMRITRIVLWPVITVARGTDRELVEQLVREAHHDCCIADTLNADVVVEPTIVTTVRS